MRLYLLRHGQAARPSHDQPKSLTPHGQKEVRAIARHFQEKGIRVGTIWHSPKTRAMETARIFQEASGNPSAGLEEKAFLRPEGDPDEAMEALEGHRGNDLLLATHLPFVAELAGRLSGDGAGLAFPTAGLAAFEREAGKWKWLWSLDPSALF